MKWASTAEADHRFQDWLYNYSFVQDLSELLLFLRIHSIEEWNFNHPIIRMMCLLLLFIRELATMTSVSESSLE